VSRKSTAEEDRSASRGARRAVASGTADGGVKPVLPGVVLCFFLSGFAALLYQIAWMRQFSAVFGTSELAVAAVLAAYMGGLAAGAAAGGRLARRVRRPILAYGLLEAGIALSALAVPLLLFGARAFYAAFLGAQPTPPDAAAIGQPLFYLIVAFVVLALPTGLMGATLPLLTRYAVTRDADVGPRVALLYATNTVGAVAGTVIAGFILLPALGLGKTVLVGVAVNAFVFVVAARLARRTRLPDGLHPIEADTATRAPPGFLTSCVWPLLRRTGTPADRLKQVFRTQPGWIAPLMLLSGANAFFYEVLWTRMLAHVMGASIYAFATMLAAFLTGIALGGAFAGKVAAQRGRAAPAFALTQLAIAALSIGVYSWMGPLIPAAQTTGTLALYAISVLLPATVFIGATFPLAVRILALDAAAASSATARIYAWNTVGAIAGAVLAGFVLIPALGFEGSIKLAVTINVGLALWSAAFVAPPRLGYTAVCAAALAALWLFYHPARPQAVIASSSFTVTYPIAPREVFYSVGRSATVLLLEEDGRYFLRTNGLPEATIAARGSIPAQDPEKWLTALPVVARPDAQTMLVIGLGGGVALEGIPSSVRAIDVVELEPEVINANRMLADKRANDPLADPRVNLVVNDARNALRLTDKSYDVIVSQPSHPWTAGASHLFTREFVAESKRHLNGGGAFVQWISSEFVDEPLLRSLAATVAAEFEHVRLYQPSPRFLIFVASSDPLNLELQLAATGRPLAADALHYSYLGLNGVADLVAAIAMDEAGLAAFAAEAPISTDDDNRMATRSRARADGLVAADLVELFAEYDPLRREGSWIYTRLAGDLNFGYLADRLIRSGQGERAVALTETAPSAADRFLIAGLLYQNSGQEQQAMDAFVSALRTEPRSLQARFRLIKPSLGRLSQGTASAELASYANGLSGSAAAVVQGWAYGASRDWVSLARLDGELARTRVTDAWFPEVAWLRALWRANVTRDPERYANDAIRLIDRALVLAPDDRLYSLRAQSAVSTGDPDYVIESFRYFAASMRVRLRSGRANAPGELATMQNNLVGMERQLRLETFAGDPQRTGDVLNDVEELVQMIERR